MIMLSALVAGIAAAEVTSKPNIIWIMADDLGFGDEEPFFLYLALPILHGNSGADWLINRLPDGMSGHRARLGMEVPDVGSYATEDWPRRADNNAIAELALLAELTALEAADLRGNRIEDAPHLAKLGAHVDIRGNPAVTAVTR